MAIAGKGLAGKGFLAIWNDVSLEGEAEWLDWHTREHMPERVGVAGFLGGRRYADARLMQHKYFTLYLGETLATFSSPAYVERLNNPTPWTAKLAPHFRNFVRGACHNVASVGVGTGGAILTIRVGIDAGASLDGQRSAAMLERLIQHPGLIGAHLGLADAAVTGVPTRERSMRGATAEPIFEGVVLVEGLGRAELAAAQASIIEAITGAGLGLVPAETAIYDLSIALDKSQL